jgi:DNA-binding LytR/AlgR family response regulator
MIKAIAIDDEPLAVELIETYCQNIEGVQFIKGFTNTALAFDFIQKNTINLLFLDINMPAISGIDFYKSLQQKPMLIFTTSYSEYALESYELNAVDYLLKPFTIDRFKKAILKASDLHKLTITANIINEPQYLILKVDYGIVKILLSDILFIEGLDNYLKINLQNQAPLIVRLTIKALMKNLQQKEFLRVHRSYIVPINRIESVKQKMILIAGQEIPIGKFYEAEFKSIFKSNF